MTRILTIGWSVEISDSTTFYSFIVYVAGGKFGSAVGWKQLLPCNGRTAIARHTSITWQLDTTRLASFDLEGICELP